MKLSKHVRGLLVASTATSFLLAASVGVANALPMVKVCYKDPGRGIVCQWVPGH